MFISKVTRDFLIKVAEASKAAMTAEMTAFINELVARGRYADVTSDEIEKFDGLFDAMEGA